MNTTVAVILLAIALVLTIIFQKKKKALEDQKLKSKLSYHFLKNSLEFLIPFVFVLAFYLTLLIVVSVSMDSASLNKLIWIEEKLSLIKSWVSWFKLGAVWVVIGFAVLYLISLLKIPFEKWISKSYDWFLKLSKWAYITVVLLCSFTLLGTQFGEPTTNLQVRIRTIPKAYADLCKQAQAVLSEETAGKLYDKVRSSLPPNYITALELPVKIEEQATGLRDFYQTTQREYGIKDGKTESVLTLASQRSKTASGLQGETEATGKTGELKFSELNPEQISYQKLEQAKASLEQYQLNRSSRVITFLKAEAGKKLTMKMPKILTSQLKSQVFSSWTQSRPIAGLIVDTFFGTLDNEIETQVGKAVDKVVKSAIENPDNAPKAIEEESAKITSQKNITTRPPALEQASQSSKQLEKELGDIQAARRQIEQHIIVAEQRKIDKLISELSSPKEEVRVRAAGSLSRMGDKISKPQVQRLVSIMRGGGQTWSKFLYREEGHHCSWYEYTSVKYYAADALGGMSSPHVNQEIAREASDCKNRNKTEKKITDPGWI